MPSQWLFKLTLLSIAIRFSYQQEVDCSFSDNCDTEKNDAEIICNKILPDNECECPTGASCGDPDLTAVLTGVTANTMDAAKCTELCESLATCVFWKYNDHNIAQKFCHLMNAAQCDKGSDSPCDAPECDGGNRADGSDGRPTCEPGTENGQQTCPGPIIEFVSDGTHVVQKWDCFNSTDTKALTKVDMYAQDATMPLGGFCKLNTDDGGSCKPTDKEFRFNCELEANEGTWKPAEAYADTSDVLDTDTGVLQDIKCSAPRLEFTADGKITQKGRAIHCLNGGVEEEESGTPAPTTPAFMAAEASGAATTTYIPAENDCLMTCDDYSVLLFYTDFVKDDQGGRTWFWEVFGVTMEPIQTDNADFLDCWG